MELSAKTVYGHGPVLKITQLSAHAQTTSALNVAVNLLPPSFSATTITGSNFGNLTAFRAIFSRIFTALAQKRLFMNFRLKS